LRFRACVQRATRLPDPLVDMAMRYVGVLCVWREQAPRLLDLPRPLYGRLRCLTSGYILVDGVVAHVTEHVLPHMARLLSKAVFVELPSVTVGWWRSKYGGLSYMMDDSEVRHLTDGSTVDLLAVGPLLVNDCFWFVGSHALVAETLVESCSRPRSWPLEARHARFWCAEAGGRRLLHARHTSNGIEFLLFDPLLPQPVRVWSSRGLVLCGLDFARGSAALVMCDFGSARNLVYFTPSCGDGAVEFTLVADITDQVDLSSERVQVCLVADLIVVMTLKSACFVCPVQRKVIRSYAAADSAEFHAVFGLRETSQVVVIEIAANHAVRALVFHVENFN